ISIFYAGQNEVVQLVGDLVDEYRSRKERNSKTEPRPSGTKSSPASYRPLRCLPLHGALPQTDQLRIFDRPTRTCRKVIVATNIAEASVTLPGISYVIDCGFARIRAYNPITGLEALVTLPISQASARQRAGRAGRTRTGEAYRLYSERIFRSLPQFTPPESVRSDLSGALLRLKTLGVDRLVRFDWLDPPPPSHVGQAAERLVALGALDTDSGRLTIPKGLKLAEVSTACGLDQPSAAAALLGACEEGCSQEVAAIVALMQIQRVFVSSMGQKRTGDRLRRQFFGCRQGDHLTELNAFTAYEIQSAQCSPSDLRAWCRDVGLNERGLSHALTLRDRIGAMFARLKLPWVRAEPEGNPEPVLRALVRGYFHQVARLAPSGSYYLTVRGDHQLRLHPNSILYSSTTKWPSWILFTHVYLASSAELMGGGVENNGSGPVPTCVGGVSAIQPDWLLELAPHYYHFGTDREHLERALRKTG
ncbi:ATP dependent RNA helicase DHX35, partial [Fasciolopsis buskii]